MSRPPSASSVSTLRVGLRAILLVVTLPTWRNQRHCGSHDNSDTNNTDDNARADSDPDPANALNGKVKKMVRGGEGDGGKTDEELIAELAALSLLAYAERRRGVATELGIGVGKLDRIVKQARGQAREQATDKSRIIGKSNRGLNRWRLMICWLS